MRPDYYVQFKVGSEEGFERLTKVINALAAAKADDTLLLDDDETWLCYLSPSEQERLVETGWDINVVIESVFDAEYEIVGTVRGGHLGYVSYIPHAYPFGSTGAFQVLAEAFGHSLIGFEDGTGFYPLA